MILSYLLSSLFSRVVLPTQAENILPALGGAGREKREEITQNHKNGIGLVLENDTINLLALFCVILFIPSEFLGLFLMKY
jgi:hypothetical protein